MNLWNFKQSDVNSQWPEDHEDSSLDPYDQMGAIPFDVHMTFLQGLMG